MPTPPPIPTHARKPSDKQLSPAEEYQEALRRSGVAEHEFYAPLTPRRPPRPDRPRLPDPRRDRNVLIGGFCILASAAIVFAFIYRLTHVNDTSQYYSNAEREKWKQPIAPPSPVRVSGSNEATKPFPRPLEMPNGNGTKELSAWEMRSMCRNWIQDRLDNYNIDFQHANLEEPVRKLDTQYWKSWFRLPNGNRQVFMCKYYMKTKTGDIVPLQRLEY